MVQHASLISRRRTIRCLLRNPLTRAYSSSHGEGSQTRLMLLRRVGFFCEIADLCGDVFWVKSIHKIREFRFQNYVFGGRKNRIAVTFSSFFLTRLAISFM